VLPLIQPPRNGNDEKRKWIQTRSHHGSVTRGGKFTAPDAMSAVSGQYAISSVFVYSFLFVRLLLLDHESAGNEVFSRHSPGTLPSAILHGQWHPCDTR
jgi:hypothetical protein